MNSNPFHVIKVTGFAGDRTPEAMAAVPDLASLVAGILNADILPVGTSSPPLDLDWREALKASAPTLRDTAGAVRDTLADLHCPAIIAPRCAVAIGSLPPLLAAYPDAVLIWLDAHGDLQLPDTSDSGYLGGMPISALLGRWDSGYGMGAASDRLIHIGGRDLDPPENSISIPKASCILPRISWTKTGSFFPIGCRISRSSCIWIVMPLTPMR